jgi:mannose-6-phosphate isomerase-like protein (cupin superfamily)
MKRRLAILALVPLLIAPGAGSSPPVLDALLADGRLTLPLAELAELVPLPEGEGFALHELGRDAHASHHVVAIREREVLHRHDRHDLFVVILRGHGGMLLGDEERPVGQGSILYVPRGTVHAFRNASPDPALAYAVYAPAFDGKDRVIID